MLRVIQQLRGQNFAIYDPHPPPCMDSFYTVSVEKIDIFYPHPLQNIHVVIQWPLAILGKVCKKVEE